jgi:hypothetical protein
MITRFLLPIILCVSVCAQSGKPVSKPIATDEVTAYLLPDDLKLQFRAGQLEWDELEIDTQKMLVKIEQNKQRQKQIEDDNRLRALQFARDKNIDLQLWIIDAKELKFVKKGKK